MKYITVVFSLLTPLLFLSGCGESSSEGESTTQASVTQGWHFQGRDCLACHNVDLSSEKHLLVAGTLYKNLATDATTQDNQDAMCGGNLILNIYDAAAPSNLIYSSKNYEDSASKGYKAKGNIFILQRNLALLSQGSYFLEITDAQGHVLAEKYRHTFSSQPYDINNPQDFNNQVSCGACHSPAEGSRAYPLYVNAFDAVKYCQ